MTGFRRTDIARSIRITQRPFSQPHGSTSRLPIPIELLDERPLDVEIGCGTGLHTINHALAHPQRMVIGIEHTKSRFQRFEQNVVLAAYPKNLQAVHANAISWIDQHLPIHAVDRFFLLYPNPYPKFGQRNRRWHLMPFMLRMKQCLKPQGTIELATNIRDYANEASEFMTQVWGFKQLDFSCVEQTASARTLFEKKYLQRQQTCFNLVFGKS